MDSPFARLEQRSGADLTLLACRDPFKAGRGDLKTAFGDERIHRKPFKSQQNASQHPSSLLQRDTEVAHMSEEPADLNLPKNHGSSRRGLAPAGKSQDQPSSFKRDLDQPRSPAQASKASSGDEQKPQHVEPSRARRRSVDRQMRSKHGAEAEQQAYRALNERDLHQSEQPQGIFMHYTISEDRSGDDNAMRSAILSRLAERPKADLFERKSDRNSYVKDPENMYPPKWSPQRDSLYWKSRTVFLSNLGGHVSTDELKVFFERAGRVVHAEIMVRNDPYETIRNGEIVFDEPKAVSAASSLGSDRILQKMSRMRSFVSLSFFGPINALNPLLLRASTTTIH